MNAACSMVTSEIRKLESKGVCPECGCTAWDNSPCPVCLNCGYSKCG